MEPSRHFTDALRDRERRYFELHIAHCERCQVDLRRLAEETSAALALEIKPVEPPPALRARILGAARAERRH